MTETTVATFTPRGKKPIAIRTSADLRQQVWVVTQKYGDLQIMDDGGVWQRGALGGVLSAA